MNNISVGVSTHLVDQKPEIMHSTYTHLW